MSPENYGWKMKFPFWNTRFSGGLSLIFEGVPRKSWSAKGPCRLATFQINRSSQERPEQIPTLGGWAPRTCKWWITMVIVSPPKGCSTSKWPKPLTNWDDPPSTGRKNEVQPKKWRWMEDDVPFQRGDFQVLCYFSEVSKSLVCCP